MINNCVIRVDSAIVLLFFILFIVLLLFILFITKKVAPTEPPFYTDPMTLRTLSLSAFASVLLITGISASASNYRSAVNPLSPQRTYAPRRATPTKTLSPTDARLRNDQRRRDLTTIANAMFAYTHDGHDIPKIIPYDPQEICRTTGPSCKGLLDLVSILTPYLTEAQLPSDPAMPAGSMSTGYTVYTNTWRTRLYYAAPLTDGIMIRLQK